MLFIYNHFVKETIGLLVVNFIILYRVQYNQNLLFGI